MAHFDPRGARLFAKPRLKAEKIGISAARARPEGLFRGLLAEIQCGL